MKVLHAAETIKGGVATVLRMLLVDQTARGGRCDVRALVPATHVGELRSASGYAVTYPRSGRNVISLLRFAWALWKLLLSYRPDVLHLHSTFAGTVGRVLILFIPKSRRPSVIYCPHAFSFLMARSRIRIALYTWIERLLTPISDRIVCISKYERNRAVEAGLHPDKLVLIYNGIEVPGQLSRCTNETRRTTKLLFVGRLDEQKGFDILLHAMDRLDPEQFELTVVGEAVNGEAAAEMRSNIRYAGWVSGSQLDTYYAQADVVVMPSRWEGFGLVAAEAGARGVAVVASDCCSVPEIVEDGRTGRLFATGDATSLANILRGTPKADWWALGEKARSKVLSTFRDDLMCQKIWDLYQKCGASA